MLTARLLDGEEVCWYSTYPPMLRMDGKRSLWVGVYVPYELWIWWYNYVFLRRLDCLFGNEVASIIFTFRWVMCGTDVCCTAAGSGCTPPFGMHIDKVEAGVRIPGAGLFVGC